MDYQQFLLSKQQSTLDQGFDCLYMPSQSFDYQSYIIEKSLKKGRCAVFADTGLGKTLMQLAIANNIIKKTNKRVLILTPLAVAFQFVKEANNLLGIDDIEQTKDGKFTKNIVLCNYERLSKLNPDDFEGVILDESSILKNFDGKIKHQVTAFIKKVNYRFLFTATPSPNDHIELGTSSEALGYLGYIDMLSKFFKNNQNNSVKASQTARANKGEKWSLKAHAENDFWKWVSTWSISIKKPSDLGFNNEGYELPDLIENSHVVDSSNVSVVDSQFNMFKQQAESFKEIKAEVRSTINERCEKAVEVANQHDISVYWVNLNDESSIIKNIDKDSFEIKGSMSLEKKEEYLEAFSRGEIKKLITKTSITAFGLNWQHCNHTTYFPTYSFEQYYQAIRRFWRFGQKNTVIADLILSDGQKKIIETLQAKKEKSELMFKELVKSANSEFKLDSKDFNQTINKPKF